MIKIALKKGSKLIITNPTKAAELLGVHKETVRRWYRDKKLVFINGYEVLTDVEEVK